MSSKQKVLDIHPAAFCYREQMPYPHFDIGAAFVVVVPDSDGILGDELGTGKTAAKAWAEAEVFATARQFVLKVYPSARCERIATGKTRWDFHLSEDRYIKVGDMHLGQGKTDREAWLNAAENIKEPT